MKVSVVIPPNRRGCSCFVYGTDDEGVYSFSSEPQGLQLFCLWNPHATHKVVKRLPISMFLSRGHSCGPSSSEHYPPPPQNICSQGFSKACPKGQACTLPPLNSPLAISPPPSSLWGTVAWSRCTPDANALLMPIPSLQLHPVPVMHVQKLKVVWSHGTKNPQGATMHRAQARPSLSTGPRLTSVPPLISAIVEPHSCTLTLGT